MYSYEADFIQSLLSGKKKLASQFNFTYRYIDGVLSINNPYFENNLGQMYPAKLEIKNTTESNTSPSYLDSTSIYTLSLCRGHSWRVRLAKQETLTLPGHLVSPLVCRVHECLPWCSFVGATVTVHQFFCILHYSCRSEGTVRCALPFMTSVTISTEISQCILSSNVPSLPAYDVFISQLIRYARACCSYECFVLRAARLSSKLLGQGYVRFSSSECYTTFWRITIYSDTLHWWDILPVFDPLLIWTVLPNLTFYLIVWGFNRTFATGAACQQRTLTPPDTWSCPSLGLVCVLISRPMSPELILFPDFWVSNIPRYFCFDQGSFMDDMGI